MSRKRKIEEKKNQIYINIKKVYAGLKFISKIENEQLSFQKKKIYMMLVVQRISKIT